MPPAMTVKLKKISVAAAINSVLLPRAMTSGSRLNRLMMGLEKMATGTQAAIITAEPIHADAEGEPVRQIPASGTSACPTSAVSCVGEAVGGQIKQSLGLIGQIVRCQGNGSKPGDHGC